VLDRCERGHVAAGLGEDDLGGAASDAGDRAQQLDRRASGPSCALNRGREVIERLVEVIDVREDAPDHERVLGVEAAFQRLLEGGQFLAQLAAREIGQHAADRSSRTRARRASRAPSGPSCRWPRSPA
jgi:hypothetical protein